MRKSFFPVLFFIIVVAGTVVKCLYPPLCDEAGQFDFVCVEPINELSEEELQRIQREYELFLSEEGIQQEVGLSEEALQRLFREISARTREPVRADEMVPVPAGSFDMGDLSGEAGPDERPVRRVTVPAFRLGKYEVTFAQWNACVADGGCNGYVPEGNFTTSGRADLPVGNVSWHDVQLFIDWLNGKTGGSYRLPTEAEWEFAARAGTKTFFSWGNDPGNNLANCVGCGVRREDSLFGPMTTSVGSFPANAWGLHDMHGNVSEWVQDCWNDSYEDAPTSGSAYTGGDCGLRVRRGGDWTDEPWQVRSASRSYNSPHIAAAGFRLAQDE